MCLPLSLQHSPSRRLYDAHSSLASNFRPPPAAFEKETAGERPFSFDARETVSDAASSESESAAFEGDVLSSSSDGHPCEWRVFEEEERRELQRRFPPSAFCECTNLACRVRRQAAAPAFEEVAGGCKMRTQFAVPSDCQ